LAHSHKLTHAHQAALAADLAPLLRHAHPADASSSNHAGQIHQAKLAENFEIWTIPSSMIRPFEGRLSLIARQTGRLHHQIRLNRHQRATHVAQSSMPIDGRPGGRLLVHSVMASPLAAQIDQAAAFIDDAEKGEHDLESRDVRLLHIPSRLIHAFWLAGPNDDKIVVIDMPQQTSGLKLRHVYDAHEFLTRLLKTPAIKGPTTVRPLPQKPTEQPRPRGALEKAADQAAKTIRDIRRFFIFFLVGNLVWMVLIAAATANGAMLETMGKEGLLSGAAMIVGGLFGFVFGIPRSLASISSAIAQQSGGGQPAQQFNVAANTNLEQISDWLTKVLVGVGLTQLDKVPHMLSHIRAILANDFPVGTGSGTLGGGTIGLAILLAFGTAGFVWAYFESRTSLMRVFSDDDPPGTATAAPLPTSVVPGLPSAPGTPQAPGIPPVPGTPPAAPASVAP